MVCLGIMFVLNVRINLRSIGKHCTDGNMVEHGYTICAVDCEMMSSVLLLKIFLIFVNKI